MKKIEENIIIETTKIADKFFKKHKMYMISLLKILKTIII